MWSALSFCYTLLVILRKNRVNALYCWTRQISMDMTAEERKGDWRQRMNYAVDFVQAETQLFSGGPCHALWCEPEHYVKIMLLDENFGSMHQWVSPFGRKILKTSIQESVPATFKNLCPDTRVIIDSAEIETDRSHNLILSLWRGSTTSVELWRAASFIHSQVHCNQ